MQFKQGRRHNRQARQRTVTSQVADAPRRSASLPSSTDRTTRDRPRHHRHHRLRRLDLTALPSALRLDAVVTAAYLAAAAPLSTNSASTPRCCASWAPACSRSPPSSGSSRVGGLLRDWRRRRRLSQLDLALEAGISTRHLSFVETGPDEAQRRDGAAPRRAARRPAARTQRAAARGRLRAGRRQPRARRADDGLRPRGARPAARRPRALLGARRRPPLGHGHCQPRRSACSPATSPCTCSSRPSTSCASRRIRTAWRRGSRASHSGARTCSTVSAVRRRAAATRRSRRCTRSWRPTRPAVARPRSTPKR